MSTKCFTKLLCGNLLGLISSFWLLFAFLMVPKLGCCLISFQIKVNWFKNPYFPWRLVLFMRLPPPSLSPFLPPFFFLLKYVTAKPIDFYYDFRTVLRLSYFLILNEDELDHFFCGGGWQKLVILLASISSRVLRTKTPACLFSEVSQPKRLIFFIPSLIILSVLWVKPQPRRYKVAQSRVFLFGLKDTFFPRRQTRRSWYQMDHLIRTG